ncbi:hypothetical protein E1J23_20745 [Xanthomonas gardneri]|nr:hypothetical protein [Xanthomonas hortorum pv. vitians]NMI32007.1 hypothetical protein [Xanthomonas hortorum pv. vitians]NMI44869.1 hypothetical protein [Xanthomonas hortorum pv. vitians]NMI49785.1 hypothetical protein [Xanthomonas hortorum pv. gardneri]
MRHLQCDTRMTDYAALKLTEMFAGVERLPQRGAACALTITWSRWRSLEIRGLCIPHLACFSHIGDVSIAPHRSTAGRGGLGKRRRAEPCRARVRSYACVWFVRGAIGARVPRVHARGGRRTMH